MNYDIERPSPYYGGYRSSTAGIILHSTRGNAASVEQEFAGTLNWFQSNPYEISAHAVIAFDGRIARCVEEGRIAHHAGIHNGRWLGVELVQPRPGDPISDAQYQTLARWCQSMGEQFGFTPGLLTLQEHRHMPQGIGSGKSDIGPPFLVAVLLDYINTPQEPPMTDVQKAAIRNAASEIQSRGMRVKGYGAELGTLQHENYDEALTSTGNELLDLAGQLNSLADET